MKENMPLPSTRAKVYHLVQNYAMRTGKSAGEVWSLLYKAFETETNRRWRQMANWNGEKPLETIHTLGQMDALLECARRVLPTEYRLKQGAKL